MDLRALIRPRQVDTGLDGATRRRRALVVTTLVLAVLTAMTVVLVDRRTTVPPEGEGTRAPSVVAEAGAGRSREEQDGEPAAAAPRGVDRTTRSRAGAVAAAAGYATLLARMFPLSRVQARAVAADAASAGFRSRLMASVDEDLLPLQEHAAGLGGSTTYRQAVLATRVVSYGDSGAQSTSPGQETATRGGRAWARVSVWTVLTVSHTPDSRPDESDDADGGASGGTGGDEVANAHGSFSTVVIDLSWQRGAWRLSGDSTLRGPTPLIDGSPSTGPELNAALRGFRDWRPA